MLNACLTSLTQKEKKRVAKLRRERAKDLFRERRDRLYQDLRRKQTDQVRCFRELLVGQLRLAQLEQQRVDQVMRMSTIARSSCIWGL